MADKLARQDDAEKERLIGGWTVGLMGGKEEINSQKDRENDWPLTAELLVILARRENHSQREL